MTLLRYSGSSRGAGLPFVERFRETGRGPSLAEKLETAGSTEELDGMVAAIGARGQELTTEERAAAARRRAVLAAGRR